MTNFKVTWSITIHDVDDPREAAEEALNIIRSTTAWDNYFIVKNLETGGISRSAIFAWKE